MEENNLTAVKGGSNLPEQVGADCFAPKTSWLCLANWLQPWQQVELISVRLPDSEWFQQCRYWWWTKEREREMGSAPLFCLELIRPNFLINKTLTTVWVSLAVCCAGRLFKLPGILTQSETTELLPQVNANEEGHYQQENWDQEVISVGEEEGNSI